METCGHFIFTYDVISNMILHRYLYYVNPENIKKFPVNQNGFISPYVDLVEQNRHFFTDSNYKFNIMSNTVIHLIMQSKNQ